LQFNYTPPQTELENFLGGFYYVNAIGLIESGDAERFQEFLEKSNVPAASRVYIDSLGGDVDAAIDIGRIVRDNQFSTEIGQYQIDYEDSDVPIFNRNHINGKCLSAATLVYLGGRLRYFSEGNEFGVHRFSFKNPTPENVERSQALSAKIATYISDMGVSLEFLELSSATSSDEMSLIAIDKLKRLEVVTGGTTNVEWSVQAQGDALYVRGERYSLFGHHKVMLAFSKDMGFLFWAVIEPQGRHEELTSFGLVEIVLNGEDIRIDISERCQREVINDYVNIFAQLSLHEAQAIAFSESFGVQVRFSKEADMFLGVSAMSTDGGQEQLQSFFNNLSSI